MFRFCSLLRKESAKAELARSVDPSLITQAYLFLYLDFFSPASSLPGSPCFPCWPWICSHFPAAIIIILIILLFKTTFGGRPSKWSEQTPRLKTWVLCSVRSPCVLSFPYLVGVFEIVHTEMSLGPHSPHPFAPTGQSSVQGTTPEHSLSLPTSTPRNHLGQRCQSPSTIRFYN